MLHLREMGLLHLDALTASGKRSASVLDWWEQASAASSLRPMLEERDGVDPDDVIMNPTVARARGLTSTVAFPAATSPPTAR